MIAIERDRRAVEQPTNLYSSSPLGIFIPSLIAEMDALLNSRLICILPHTRHHRSISNSMVYYDMIAIERNGRFVEQPTNMYSFLTRYLHSISNSANYHNMIAIERDRRAVEQPTNLYSSSPLGIFIPSLIAEMDALLNSRLICILPHTRHHRSISNSMDYYDMIAIERDCRFVERPTKAAHAPTLRRCSS
ncbi:hypothetical protein K457DRAFT_1820725 [Linnemannia elongata AG-77]|uniref:Uncharacterized protein n=1 Tax=Linnemannia elongata AG-77 TaxID=1314771 RepID=A0A197JT11_9FUNG|nr:hypothetical protein K457DRAFT_1820725 [Linnemannia elongata AG-77]